MKPIERIILFGDSFIQGVGCFQKLETDGRMTYSSIPTEDRESLIQHRNENSWKYLNRYFPSVEIINYGIDGGSNYDSFQKFTEYYQTDYRDTDLILFGFTSKFRDFKNQFNFIYNLKNQYDILSDNNPIKSNPLAWDGEQNKGFETNGFENFNLPLEEQKLTEEFIYKYLNNIHNDIHLEYVSNVNYIFLESFVKRYNINFICFDLFEKYIVIDDKNFVIDESIYLNYKSETMFEYIKNYEAKNGYPDEYLADMEFVVSYFENNKTYINLHKAEHGFFHLNQFGYQRYIDYLCKEHLLKRFECRQTL